MVPLRSTVVLPSAAWRAILQQGDRTMLRDLRRSSSRTAWWPTHCEVDQAAVRQSLHVRPCNICAVPCTQLKRPSESRC